MAAVIALLDAHPALTTCGGGTVNSPMLTAKVYTLWDGPRTDAMDTTILFVGQPRRTTVVASRISSGSSSRLGPDAGAQIHATSGTQSGTGR